MTAAEKAAARLPSLFADRREPPAAPAVPDWARQLFADRAPAPTPAVDSAAAPAAALVPAGDSRDGLPAPRSFRLEVDGTVSRIDLPQVGGSFLDSGETGLAMHDAAVAQRLAPAPDRHAPGLRGLPERGTGGGR
ncbi:hypothetical protein ACFOGJ_12120, partial [Marinibaculum pumilum]